jgi:hypothetical protein
VGGPPIILLFFIMQASPNIDASVVRYSSGGGIRIGKNNVRRDKSEWWAAVIPTVNRRRSSRQTPTIRWKTRALGSSAAKFCSTSASV